MPSNTAPGTERVASGSGQPVPAARRRARWHYWAGACGFLALLAVLSLAYFRLSATFPENSDEANILLMANDMLHGNLFLTGWHVSDVPFITTELPQMALLVGAFGLSLGTAHIAAALTYTLLVAVAMLLARGRARGPEAVARMAVALGIMLVPQPGVGIFVAIFSVGHIGTALPVMLTWLLLDRAGRRWWVPPAVAVLLGWAETADPLVLVIAILPMLAVCLVRVITGLAARERRWFEVALAAAAGAGYLIAWTGGRLLRHAGGYVQQPVPYVLDDPGKWLMQARTAAHGLLEIFGAYFVPGRQDALPGMAAPGLLDQVFAFTHLVGVALALWAACAVARRYFRRDADFVDQLLLAGIVANIAAYVPSTLAAHTALNTREIAPVLPFAAVLAGRVLGERLLRAPLGGPRVTIRAGGRRFGFRVITASLVVLLAWFGFGLWRQTTARPAPEPYPRLVSYLEHKGLKYGLGGYWQSSVITVESGGRVTVRAVTPACLQPYRWESKAEWYDPARHHASFLLLDNVPGYFNKFSPTAAGLILLNRWLGTATHDDTGTYRMVRGSRQYQYEARQYQGNVLTLLPRLRVTMAHPPEWLVRNLLSQGSKVPHGVDDCN